MVKCMNIQPLKLISPFNSIKSYPAARQNVVFNSQQYDTISFKGSKPYDYKTTFSYMASEILKEKQKSNTNTQPKNIDNAVKSIVGEYKAPNENYYKYSKSFIDKNTFPSFYNESLKENITESINESRDMVFSQWRDTLTGKNPDTIAHPIEKKLEDPVTRFIIWEGINYGVTEENRHIPSPLNLDVLDRTIDYFQNNITPKERGLKAQSIKYFSKVYNSMLIDDILTKIIKHPAYSNYNIYNAEAKEMDDIWIKLPPLKRAKTSECESIYALEVLSHENWCTKTRENKARAALESGNFYIYLSKNPFNSEYDIRTPEIAMTCSNGKIERIQGQLNNGVIPDDKFDLVLKFLLEHNYIQYGNNGNLKNIQLIADYNAEGPQSYLQVLIANSKQNFNPNFTSDDTEAVFKKLFSNKVAGNDENGLILKSYDSKAHISKDVSIPVSMLGFDEDALLSVVSVIQKNFDMRNMAVKSFPKNLKSVGGKIICTKEQYEKYKDDIIRITDTTYANRIIIREKDV